MYCAKIVTLMLQSGNLDVSVVLPFGDHEDVIGTAVQRVAAYLDERGLAFEILAVDDDSGDNSHAVLALVRSGNPRLAHVTEILTVPARSRQHGYEYGVLRARGAVIWLLDPHAAAGDLVPFDGAYQRVEAGERDVVVHKRRFSIVHRIRSGPLLSGIKGHGGQFHSRLAQRARGRGLAVEPAEAGWRSRPGGIRRLLSALSHGLTY